MSALPLRMGRRLGIVAVLAALAIPTGLATPAVAAQPDPVAKYVALGDSYAAGQGSGAPLDACLRSANAYPVLLDAEPRTNLLRQAACSGSTVAEVAAGQLTQVNRGTTLITITAGANDLGVTAVAAACLADPSSPGCADAIAAAMQVLASGQVGTDLSTLIADAAARSPRAKIVVTDYPLPFTPGLSPTTDAVVQAVVALDAQIAGAVHGAAAGGVDVELASLQLAFLGHAADAGQAAWFNANPTDPVSFLHPNAAGQLAYRDAVLLALAS